MADTFNVVDWITMKGLRRLLNKLQVAEFFNTSYNKEYTKPWAIGDTTRIPYPQRYTIRDGTGYSPQPLDRPFATASINQPFGIDFEWPDIDQVLRMERGDERITEIYIDPAMDQIAQEIDSRAALWAKNHSNNSVGVLGSDPTSMQTFGQARQTLYELAGWTGNQKGIIVPPSVNTALVNANSAKFNPDDEITQEFREGTIGKAAGFRWFESMSLYDHTAGTWQGAVTVTTGGLSGNQLTLTCTTGDTFNEGDILGIQAVYPVNPSTRRRTQSTKTMQVVVRANAVGASSTVTLTISPPLIGPGSQYQNVDALPLAGATVTLFPGTTNPNGKTGKNGLAITSDAFALVGVPLEKPINQQAASMMRDPQTGLSVRFVRSWDPIQSKMVNRFDTVIGFGDLYSNPCVVRVLCA